MYAKCGSLEDAWGVFNKMPSQVVVAWSTMICGHVKCRQGKKALELFRQMQQEGLMDEGMCLYASMIRDYMILAKWNIAPAWLTFLVMLAIYRRQRIWSWKYPVNHRWLLGWLCLTLTEFMVTSRWQNTMPNEFLKWSLKMLLVMYCCQTSMLLLATYISVRMLNIRERKKVQRNARNWIEVNNEVHIFVLGDQDHPLMIEIHSEL